MLRATCFVNVDARDVKFLMCYNETNMDLASSQTFFWLCFGVAVFAVSAFLCWVLYEIARMIRQGNEVVEHTREIVSGIEEDVAQAKEKLGGVLGSLAGVAAATKGLASLAGASDQKTKTRSVKKRYNRLLDEEEEVE
ncbi:MAG: hypothetical protein BWY14_00375 [Parcubacteria group bacterium ADurb.Bin192]|nr:MAG: hypothetical protein BWY14_00375 [Parcubacteria group bacterium ADurb.Bin192]